MKPRRGEKGLEQRRESLCLERIRHDARGSVGAIHGAARRVLQALRRIAIAATQVAAGHAQEQMPASRKQSLSLERGEDFRNVAVRHAERPNLARRVRRGHEGTLQRLPATDYRLPTTAYRKRRREVFAGSL